MGFLQNEMLLSPYLPILQARCLLSKIYIQSEVGPKTILIKLQSGSRKLWLESM